MSRARTRRDHNAFAKRRRGDMRAGETPARARWAAEGRCRGCGGALPEDGATGARCGVAGAGRRRGDGLERPPRAGQSGSHGATSIAIVRTAGGSTRRAFSVRAPGTMGCALERRLALDPELAERIAWRAARGNIPPGKDARRNARLPMAASVPEGAGRTGGGPDTLPQRRGDEPLPTLCPAGLFAARQPFAPRPKAAKRRLKRATCPSVSTMRRPPPVHAG